MIKQGIYKLKHESLQIDVIGECREPESGEMYIVYRDMEDRQLCIMPTYDFTQRFKLLQSNAEGPH